MGYMDMSTHNPLPPVKEGGSKHLFCRVCGGVVGVSMSVWVCGVVWCVCGLVCMHGCVCVSVFGVGGGYGVCVCVLCGVRV